jgi:NAD(P)H-hydrate epimerase
LVGPGLGQAAETRAFLLALLASLRGMSSDARPRLVVDADGLNNLAQADRWWTMLPPESVLTPHPGEIGRLLGGKHVSGGGADRLEVRRWAADWGHVVVLKGACTLIAAPDSRLRVHWPPNPALASAGTGDVLAGAIVGLLAQGLAPFDAASLGVFLHGCSGQVVSARLGDAGLLASDLLPELPVAIHMIK